uniref:DUF4269 domain-containing protein n=1 Tax=Mucilaginibacter sp. Bleaf8 TaxID=2834430 RepID=UPI0020BDD747|nr:DUF4269 domain-containing protein [Mucilaginibacter sp. Bleaf8]
MFLKIDYLTNGTLRQQQAYQTLSTYKILEGLSYYSPILTGTIPLNIDIESSDLDIICCYDDAEQFMQTLRQLFSGYSSFKTEQTTINGENTVTAILYWIVLRLKYLGNSCPRSSKAHTGIYLLNITCYSFTANLYENKLSA